MVSGPVDGDGRDRGVDLRPDLLLLEQQSPFVPPLWILLLFRILIPFELHTAHQVQVGFMEQRHDAVAGSGDDVLSVFGDGDGLDPHRKGLFAVIRALALEQLVLQRNLQNVPALRPGKDRLVVARDGDAVKHPLDLTQLAIRRPDLSRFSLKLRSPTKRSPRNHQDHQNW